MVEAIVTNVPESGQMASGRWDIEVKTTLGLHDLLYELDKFKRRNAYHYDVFTSMPTQNLLISGFSVIHGVWFDPPLTVKLLIKQVGTADPRRISRLVEDLMRTWKVNPIRDTVGGVIE